MDEHPVYSQCLNLFDYWILEHLIWKRQLVRILHENMQYSNCYRVSSRYDHVFDLLDFIFGTTLDLAKNSVCIVSHRHDETIA